MGYVTYYIPLVWNPQLNQCSYDCFHSYFFDYDPSHSAAVCMSIHQLLILYISTVNCVIYSDSFIVMAVTVALLILE